ncbi:DUF2267 domain-containing protein [Streptomyces dangxiongensis]|uniref:DUF2267 domain-containing protein n=1 Tax=Streptomyces dangxiongensis TaxID=1442032 RepID=A0A3G2JND7_9ACTN|nr:DUF2267 domain-containing protein [Streptomyces dangxiongensis]AYN41117.1 DUF2267 domain-containing protein [Streptomyces dangxiongensis]
MTVTTPQPRTTIPTPSHATSLRPRVKDVTEDAGWRELTEAVREAGQYPTRTEADHVTRTVLSALGGHVTGEERVALAQALPLEAGRLIASQVPEAEPLAAREFVESVATRIEGSTPATARWDVSTVLSVLSDHVGEPLTTRVLSQLPPGYALLFGRADLAAAA